MNGAEVGIGAGLREHVLVNAVGVDGAGFEFAGLVVAIGAIIGPID